MEQVNGAYSGTVKSIDAKIELDLQVIYQEVGVKNKGGRERVGGFGGDEGPVKPQKPCAVSLCLRSALGTCGQAQSCIALPIPHAWALREDQGLMEGCYSTPLFVKYFMCRLLTHFVFKPDYKQHHFSSSWNSQNGFNNSYVTKHGLILPSAP